MPVQHTKLLLHVLSLWIVLVLLLGCGKNEAHRIVCFGDSLTAGPRLSRGGTYPERLEKILQADGYAYEVVNAGIPGDTTEDGVGRIQSSLHAPVDILILELGTNDVLRQIPADAIQRNLAEMIRRVQARNVAIVLAGVVAPADAPPEYRAQVTSLYRDLAVRFHIHLIPDFMKDVRASPGAMRRDGIHYNGKGAEILARSVYIEIKPLLVR